MTGWAWLAAGFGTAIVLFCAVAAVGEYRAQSEREDGWTQDGAMLFLIGFIPLFILLVAPFLALHSLAAERRQDDAWMTDCARIATVLDTDWNIVTEPLLDREVCLYRLDGRWIDRETLGLSWWAERMPAGVWPVLSDGHSDPAGW